MLTTKTFVKKTRRGGVLKIVREHYLRDDIWCSSNLCQECEHEKPVLDTCPERKSTEVALAHYLLPDTNVVLHQVKCKLSITMHSCLSKAHSHRMRSAWHSVALRSSNMLLKGINCCIPTGAGAVLCRLPEPQNWVQAQPDCGPGPEIGTG